jgi:hypothetical protein
LFYIAAYFNATHDNGFDRRNSNSSVYICAADSYILKIKLFAVVNTFAYYGGGAAVQGVRFFLIKKWLNER